MWFDSNTRTDSGPAINERQELRELRVEGGCAKWLAGTARGSCFGPTEGGLGRFGGLGDRNVKRLSLRALAPGQWSDVLTLTLESVPAARCPSRSDRTHSTVGYPVS